MDNLIILIYDAVMEFSPDECDRCGAKVKPDIDFDDIKRWLWKYKGINKELLIKCGVIGG